jgi:hypothetical protein
MNLAQGEQWGALVDTQLFLTLLNRLTLMGIRSSIGLAISIIVLKLLMGNAFSAFEQTLTQFFQFGDVMLANVSSSL